MPLRKNIGGILSPIDNSWDDKLNFPVKEPVFAYEPVPLTIEPVKEPPALPENPHEFIPLPPGKGEVVLYKNYVYQGHVIDPAGYGVPGASVYLMLQGQKIAGVVADSTGYFTITSQQQPTTIVISSTGFIPWEWEANSQQTEYKLQPDIKDIDPVILPPGVPPANKKDYSWLLLLLLVPLLDQKKKVGKIEMSTVLTIAAGLAVVLGWNTITKLLAELGLWDTQDQKDFDHEASDPGSFWHPPFWKTGPPGTKILSDADWISINDQLIDAFGYFDDNEAQAQAALKRMVTQSQLSYFSDKWQQYQGMELLKWLKGGAWPNDRLDTAEINVITNYFENLPKYK